MSILFLITTPQPTSTLFPYTTLFRSQQFRQVGIDLQYFEVVTANTPMDTALYPGLWFTSQVADSNPVLTRDRKSTRLNSSHRCISYAVFCLKKKTHRQEFG